MRSSGAIPLDARCHQERAPSGHYALAEQPSIPHQEKRAVTTILPPRMINLPSKAGRCADPQTRLGAHAPSPAVYRKSLRGHDSHTSDRWFLSVTVEMLDPPRAHRENQGVGGVNLGVSVLARLSACEKIAAPKAYAAAFKTPPVITTLESTDGGHAMRQNGGGRETRWPPSKTCSTCGYTMPKMLLAVGSGRTPPVGRIMIGTLMRQ